MKNTTKFLAVLIALGATFSTQASAKRISRDADSYEVAKANALRSARNICEGYKAPRVTIQSEEVEEFYDGRVRVVLYYKCSK